ncbi:MAG: trimethylamine methyltransferase family protein, partial [Candidatus Krumholzibacteriota bacterium]|nr:trimethylamine methyltransferase family protein [Candidatus Krumholzibacteriota bacterium]
MITGGSGRDHGRRGFRRSPTRYRQKPVKESEAMSLTPRVKWFTEETRKKIIEEAITILEKVGVFVENDEALSLLDGAGARIDREKGRAYIPPDLVTKALETAPARIKLYDRRGEVAMDLGEDRIHFNPGSAALRLYDYERGDARLPATADLVEFSTLIDALPHYAAQSTGVISADVPEGIADEYRLYIALLHSSKPVVTGTFRSQSFPVMHRMLSTVAGGDEKLRERPLAI